MDKAHLNTDSSRGSLSEAQKALLVDVLDQIVPRDGDVPGAGEAGVGRYVGETLRAAPGLGVLFSDGLLSVEGTSHEMYSKGFGVLPGDDRVNVLRRVEAEKEGFFKELVRLCYSGYYIDPEIRRLRGLDQIPPFPRGHALEPFDMGLLESVKNRGKIYRDA